jgi:probable HAF family extracellular repeat protein
MKPPALPYRSHPGFLHPNLTVLAALLSPMLALLMLWSPAVAVPPTYSLRAISPGWGQAINNQGDAAGRAPPPNTPYGTERAFLYQGGQLTDLGPLIGAGGYSEANALNTAGQVTGYFAGEPQGKGFLYGPGGRVQTFAMPGSVLTGGAGLNDAGQVVGSWFSFSGGSTGHNRALLRQTDGKLVDLGTFGGTAAGAAAINNHGSIVGWFRMANTDHAFLLPTGASAPKDLGRLGPDDNTEANAINDQEQVVGSSGDHAFLYAQGTLRDLGAFGGKATVASGINNLGQIVGNYVIAEGTEGRSFHGWVYLEGQMHDLNELLNPLAQDWTIIDVRGINDAGQIIATALNPGQGNGTFAVVLTPDKTLFKASDTPGTLSWEDPNPVELGVKFQSSVAGTVTGVRFYKGPRNTGPHVGNLWSATGRLLTRATFADETPSGWQQLNFSNPVPIAANTPYVVSYHTRGFYSADNNYFIIDHTNGPLAAPASNNSSGSGNGVYAYGSGGFPTNTWLASNYWVDLVFVAD